MPRVGRRADLSQDDAVAAPTLVPPGAVAAAAIPLLVVAADLPRAVAAAAPIFGARNEALVEESWNPGRLNGGVLRHANVCWCGLLAQRSVYMDARLL